MRDLPLEGEEEGAAQTAAERRRFGGARRQERHGIGKRQTEAEGLGKARIALGIEGDLADRPFAVDRVGRNVGVEAEVGIVDRAVRVDREPGGIAARALGDQVADVGAVGSVLANRRPGSGEAEDLGDEPVTGRPLRDAERRDEVAVLDEHRLVQRQAGALGRVGGERRGVALHSARRQTTRRRRCCRRRRRPSSRACAASRRECTTPRTSAGRTR